MTEFFLTVFIFIGVIAVTALVFGGWIVINVIRGIWSMLGLSSRRQPPGRAQAQFAPPNQWQPQQQPTFVPAPPVMNFSGAPIGTVQCGLPGCRHVNPANARFCRRCGHAFPQAQRNTTAPRRAAFA